MNALLLSLKRLFSQSNRLGTTQDAALALHRVRMPGYVRTSTRVLLLLLVSAFLFLLLSPWQQTSSVKGRVIAYAPQERDQIIDAPIKGRIVQWHVQEGEKVEKGQLLLEISDNDPLYLSRLGEQRDAVEAQRAAAQSAINDIQDQLAATERVKRLQLESYDAKIRMAQHEVDAAKRALQGAIGEEKAARLNFERKKTLAEQGLSSTRDVELGESKAVKAQADVDKARAYLEEKKSKVLSERAAREGKASEMDAKLAELRAKLASQREKLSKLEQSLSKAEVDVSRQEQNEVHAPRSGTILEIWAREGAEYVKEGDALALLVPDTESRAVEFTVSGNDAPLIWPGRKVRLQFEGWPAVQFSGWPAVAVGTFGGEVAFVDARADEKGMFRILVVPDHEDSDWPPHQILRQGARANGWVMLNEVTLGYELWRQLNGFPPALPEDVVKGSGIGKKKDDKKSK